MKPKYLVYLFIGLSLILGAQTNSYAYSETFTTGRDWLQKMSKGEKFISVYAPMILFHRYGVNFRKTPNEYAETIDKVLLENPYLEKEDVANIFASTVYAYEPESRRAFAIMKIAFDQETLKPYLLINAHPRSEVDES